MPPVDSRPDWMLNNGHEAEQAFDAAFEAEVNQAMQNRMGTDGLKFAPGAFDPGKPANWRPETTNVPAPVNTPLPPGIQPGGDNGPPGPSQPAGAGGHVTPVETPPAPAPQGGTQLPPPAPGVAPVIPDEEPTFEITTQSGDKIALTNSQAAYLLSVNSWMAGLPADVRAQMAAVETGQSVAVPKSDYDEYLASKNRPAPTQVPPPTLTPGVGVQRPTGYDPALVSGEVAEYIARLEAGQQVTPPALPSGGAGVPVEPSPIPVLTPAQQEARIQQEATNRVNMHTSIAHGLDTVATKYGLTDDQKAYMQSVLPGLNIIASIAEKHRTYNPVTGQVLTEDLPGTFVESFETAMLMDPTLRQIRDTFVFNQQTAETKAVTDAVAGKKANAATLATAPSAAVPSPTVDMTKMTPGQRQAFAREQMTQELATVLAGGQLPD